MNKFTKRKFNLKRKESMNRKLAIQILFSIFLVAVVIISKQFTTDFSDKFVNTTKEKITENFDIKNAIKTAKVNVSNTIASLPVIGTLNDSYAAPVNGSIIKKYGIDETAENPVYNHGLDIESDTQTVLSMSKGTVMIVGKNDKLSNYIVVQDGNKKIIYGKFEEVFVEKGDKLTKGDILGKLNISEMTLHIEVWEDGESLNPAKLFNLEK